MSTSIARTLAVLVIAAGILPDAARADDAAGARLLAQGRAAEAAEAFDDPAWKGIALMRSDQPWRAAAAFARAGTAASLHNLGNVYVQLGYPALAVDAYQRSLALDPAAVETRENLEMVVEALRRSRGKDGAADTSEQRELRTLPPDPAQDKPGGAGQDGEQGTSETRADDRQQPPGDAAEREPEKSGGAGPGGGQRRAGEARPGQAPAAASGGAEQASTPTEGDAAAAGQATGADGADGPPRSAAQSLAERSLATEAWLARIEDRSAVLAGRRIAAESARRRARRGPLPTPEDPL